MPAGPEQRARLLHGKALPQAIYGCEASPISGRAMQRLRTSFADALVNRSWRLRAPSLTFAAFGRTSLDPLIA
eukprot:5775332-Alexandrium_andersonii.AAC.1